MYQSRKFYKLINEITINKAKPTMIKLKPINNSNKEQQPKETSKCIIDYDNAVCLHCGHNFCCNDGN